MWRVTFSFFSPSLALSISVRSRAKAQTSSHKTSWIFELRSNESISSLEKKHTFSYSLLPIETRSSQSIQFYDVSFWLNRIKSKISAFIPFFDPFFDPFFAFGWKFLHTFLSEVFISVILFLVSRLESVWFGVISHCQRQSVCYTVGFDERNFECDACYITSQWQWHWKCWFFTSMWMTRTRTNTLESGSTDNIYLHIKVSRYWLIILSAAQTKIR